MPQRGEKAELVANAARNARESLARRMCGKRDPEPKLLDGLAEAFGLDAPPQRIEVYDNSHIQGSNAVGAMIVAGPDGFLKSQYRKFNIKGAELTPGDDFGMMKEVLTRRFQRLLKEDPDRTSGTWPDLLLIDGGAGQVSAVAGIMEDLGVEDIAMIGVAKGVDRDAGKEEFHRPGAPPVRAGDERSGAVLRPAPARRGAPVRHRRAPGEAVEVDRGDAAGRGAGRRRGAQAGAAGAFRVSAKAVAGPGCPTCRRSRGSPRRMAEAIYGYFHEKG